MIEWIVQRLWLGFAGVAEEGGGGGGRDTGFVGDEVGGVG